ncbi:MAG: hypothetical protein A2W05_11500 [Candidatus Schekmanbacteria bacterium RBG_16_38_10]|uniref:Uncharacterized protein n=1 Tax=Candidatus Schekmanbacteria bacterium RBG_16_38_10 TaxID=1817879 RepID=A0A1F7S260_9BACT|nr:MAG: hypothetical protein A2W05_11500 [Candidatus Schekmanbacteria bacterium RBG_16_38_10]
MPKKAKVGWEKAILQVIEKHNGIATLRDIYSEISLLIGKSNAQNSNHNIRGYLRRLKTAKKLIKQIGLSTYALINVELKENIFENINSREFEKTFLNEIPKENVHGYVEGMLVELGNYSGYETYTPDRNVVFNSKPLSELVSYNVIPNFSYPEVIDHAKQIDVIWFRDKFPVKTFDVENSTDFTKAFLRAYQLRYYKTKFFMVSDSERKGTYDKKVKSQPFGLIEDNSDFLSYKDVYDLYKSAAIYNQKIINSSIFR